MPNEGQQLPYEGSQEQPRLIEKQTQWTQQLQRIEGLKDGLGKSVDEGIKETVAAMQLLGILTRQSCQGHLNWGEAAPWVRIDFPAEVHELSRQHSELFDAFDKLNEGNEDFQRAADEFHKVRREQKRLQAMELKKITSLF